MKLDPLQYAVTDPIIDHDQANSSTSREVPPPKTYAEMHLKVGELVPIETIHNHYRPSMRLSGRIVGWVESNSLLLSIPLKAARTGMVKLNEQVLLRVFNGQNAYAFSTTVVKIEHFPFTYLHLTFPKKINALEVRSSARQQVNIPIILTQDGKEGMNSHILDINMTGASISTVDPLTDESPIRFTLHFDLHEVSFSLKLESHLRSSKVVQDKDGVSHHQSGLEFMNLEPNDRLILSSLLWKQMQLQMHPEPAVSLEKEVPQ